MTVESGEPVSGGYRRISQWMLRVGLARKFAIGLAIAAIASGIATYVALTGSPPLGPNPNTILILLNVDLVFLLLLGAMVCWRVVRAWGERRRGSAGSRLMTRLVVLFCLVAAAPAVIVAIFSALFFNLGIQAWFGERVRTALSESLAVTRAYLDEHQRNLRSDSLAIAGDLNRQAALLLGNPALLKKLLIAQATLRSIPEAIIFEGNGRVLAASDFSFSLQYDSIPEWAIKKAKAGKVAILTNPTEDRVRALVKLDNFFDTYLYVGRYIESQVLGHVKRTTAAVAEYQRLEGKSSDLQISFYMLFAVVALLLLVAAVWLGLMFATQLARPIRALIGAAERVRGGDLSARVEEGPVGDELGTLSRAFNRMTSQLETQRRELVEANRQLDSRRRFTETVLAGVSAGVIGLDEEGRINLPNRSGSELLGCDVDRLRGQLLGEAIPEMAQLMEDARHQPDRLVQSEIRVQRAGRGRTLLVRITAERAAGETNGYVVTFDDITALQSAQRKAAWSDVARRIAHEMKNPLTPIQLSAERLKRKYLKEVETDPEVFSTCVDTIVRHVGDIGRMVDEFSAFARMPAPVMNRENLGTLCREAIFLQKNAHADIVYRCALPEEPVYLRCDGRQIGQCLTNLLSNAADSILDREATSAAPLPQGSVVLTVIDQGDRIVVEVCDNGRGIPLDIRDRLTEPYVTTRSKGTGLGLAIVKKIMEDHDGDLSLENVEEGGARVTLVFHLAEKEAGGADELGATGLGATVTPLRKTATHGA